MHGSCASLCLTRRSSDVNADLSSPLFLKICARVETASATCALTLVFYFVGSPRVALRAARLREFFVCTGWSESCDVMKCVYCTARCGPWRRKWLRGEIDSYCSSLASIDTNTNINTNTVQPCTEIAGVAGYIPRLYMMLETIGGWKCYSAREVMAVLDPWCCSWLILIPLCRFVVWNPAVSGLTPLDMWGFAG